MTLEHTLRTCVKDRRYISQTSQAGLAGYDLGFILWDIDTIDVVYLNIQDPGAYTQNVCKGQKIYLTDITSWIGWL